MLLLLALLSIPAGPPVDIDGVIAPAEWSGAAAADIAVAPGWTVHIMLQHDVKYLYLAFTHLRHGGAERYPEIMVDPRNAGGDTWQSGQWWLHSSYNLCEGNGAFNVYERDGVFQCAQTKPGWGANHFPLTGDGVMEIRIALDKVGLAPGRPFGLALDVTDTKTNWALWPPGAALARPGSWGRAQLQ
jgi:hypothetical protein